jgi:hypothetical protein
MFGGHANDYDTFEAWIRYHSREDLLTKMEKLGIVLKTQAEARLETGKKSLFTISAFPDLVYPGSIYIDEVRCYVRIDETYISFVIVGTGSNNSYSLTTADFMLV